MGAATSVANGALEDAAALLKEEFDEVGEVFEDVVEAAGRTLDDVLEGVGMSNFTHFRLILILAV